GLDAAMNANFHLARFKFRLRHLIPPDAGPSIGGDTGHCESQRVRPDDKLRDKAIQSLRLDCFAPLRCAKQVLFDLNAGTLDNVGTLRDLGFDERFYLCE